MSIALRNSAAVLAMLALCMTLIVVTPRTAQAISNPEACVKDGTHAISEFYKSNGRIYVKSYNRCPKPIRKADLTIELRQKRWWGWSQKAVKSRLVRRTKSQGGIKYWSVKTSWACNGSGKQRYWASSNSTLYYNDNGNLFGTFQRNRYKTITC